MRADRAWRRDRDVQGSNRRVGALRAPSIALERADDDVVEDSQAAERLDDLKGPGDAKLAELIGPQSVDALPAEIDLAAI